MHTGHQSGGVDVDCHRRPRRWQGPRVRTAPFRTVPATARAGRWGARVL